MTYNQLPSPELLRKLLNYDCNTGRMFWLERTIDMFTDGKLSAEHNAAAWNGRYAGEMAFTAISGSGYFQGKIFGTLYQSHRVIWAIKTGDWPEYQIDHINHHKTDNRWINLREVSGYENSRNQSIPSNNTSGTIGVYWLKDRLKWKARIHCDGKNIHLGYFNDKLDAIEARAAAEMKYGFHKNHGSKNTEHYLNNSSAIPVFEGAAE